MKIIVETRISRPIDDVWAIAADDFSSIQRWSASVITSKALERKPHIEAPTGGRYCTFTDDPNGFGAEENIIKYDKANYHLGFDVIPKNAPAPLPLKRNHVTITLKKLSEGETELTWVAEPELKAHGYVLYPILKMGVTKSFKGILKELKEYAESQEKARAA